MYYLLENNRIIDSEKFINSKLRKSWNKENSENSYEYLYEIRNGQSYYYGKIKKQSKNVYELIEVGDLVKTLGIFRVDEINTPLKQIYSFLDRESIMVINPLGVKAIYKPDEKGNYIKVWEKKDE